MTKFTRIAILMIVPIVFLGVGTTVNATPLILNGGFESGFSSWIRVNQVGSEGTFFLQTGTLSPLVGDPVPSPPEGVTAAMTDAAGPGSHGGRVSPRGEAPCQRRHHRGGS